MSFTGTQNYIATEELQMAVNAAVKDSRVRVCFRFGSLPCHDDFCLSSSYLPRSLSIVLCTFHGVNGSEEFVNRTFLARSATNTGSSSSSVIVLSFGGTPISSAISSRQCSIQLAGFRMSCTTMLAKTLCESSLVLYFFNFKRSRAFS